MRDVLANPHARRLLSVSFLQQVATGTVTTAAAYHTQYVLGDAGAFPLLLGCFFVASLVSIPLWLRVGRRVDKKPLLVGSMIAVGAIMARHVRGGRGRSRAASSRWRRRAASRPAALDVIMPSLQADVIDWDELRTGERKEGVYFAAWHLAEKLALGVAAAVDRARARRERLRAEPAAGRRRRCSRCASCSRSSRSPASRRARCVFVRFGLDRAAHARVQRELDATRGCAVAA